MNSFRYFGGFNVMKIKFLFLSLWIFVTVNVLSSVDFELNLGFGFDFPVSTISNFYKTALDVGRELESTMSILKKAKIIRNFADMVNISKSGLTYGGYVQMGAKFDDFCSLGFELGLDFNVFRSINSKGRLHNLLSFVSAIEPKFYTRLDFFIGAVTFFTGPRVNIATAIQDSILAEFGIFGWDLGARATCAFLTIEGYYCWNIQNNKFSDFKFGVGLEFGVV
ncbi:uncharacterized conserved protein [Borrelia recurrentis A1]|uniref:Exported protein n=3 Tax=Borreliaceae TaxID=1643685 RepID=W5SHH1_9SPIR|nr:uncharacterized conserved protein [Borrelia recurrentis A1]AHH06604.1 Putative exported protein [Borrelia crocidurae DOU]